MNATAAYDALRHLADSWGLIAMFVIFAAFVAWPFRPGARGTNEDAARMIFESDDHDD